jgi:hypothetical protein
MELLVSDQPAAEREAVRWLLDLPGELRRVGSSMPTCPNVPGDQTGRGHSLNAVLARRTAPVGDDPGSSPRGPGSTAIGSGVREPRGLPCR